MQNSIFILFVALLFGSPGLVLSEEAEDRFEPVYATVLSDKVNIRAGCGLNFEILGQLKESDEVVVIGQKYGWYKIMTPEGTLCFVRKDYIDKGVVQANRLRVRAGKGTNFNVVGLLKEGDAVNILEENGDWLRIVPPEGCSGWVKKDYLRVSGKKFTPPIPKTSLLQKAIEFQGIVEDLGKIVNRQGTHKLIKDNKIIYYLKSENFNLNHYVYQKVGVKGTLIDAKDSPYPVIAVEQIRLEQ